MAVISFIVQAPWEILTLRFLCNLRMGPKSYSETLLQAERLARDKHSSLLGPFITYEENKVLQILPVDRQFSVLPSPRLNVVTFYPDPKGLVRLGSGSFPYTPGNVKNGAAWIFRWPFLHVFLSVHQCLSVIPFVCT